MFKKIIAAIDGLDGGYDALALAETFAGDNPGTTVIATAAFPYETKRTRASLEGFEEAIRGETQQMLDQVLSAAGHQDDERYETHVVADYSPARALHDFAQREEADLIVVGSCRHGLIGRILIGDVSRDVLHGSPVPVAVAPRAYRTDPVSSFKLIGVGLNHSPEANDALELAAEIAADNDAKLHLVASIEQPKAMAPQYAFAIDWVAVEEAERKEMRELVTTAMADLKVEADGEVVGTSAGMTLEKFSQQADLVVTGSRSYGAVRRVMLGSTSNWLAHHASCPLLVVPSTASDRSEHEDKETANA